MPELRADVEAAGRQVSENVVLPAVAGTDVGWRNPAVEPPPLGVRMLLFTSGGVAVTGSWESDSNLVAWAPYPKRPPGLTQGPGGRYAWSETPE